MTNFSQDIRPYRSNKTDSNGNFREENLILADLNATTDDSALQIAPLRHWQDDEEAMGRLVINTESDGLPYAQEIAVPDTGKTDIFLGAREVLPILDQPITPLVAINEPVVPSRVSRIEPLLDGIGLTDQADERDAAIKLAKKPLKPAAVTPSPTVMPPETVMPFVVESFVASHRVMRTGFNTGQNGATDNDNTETELEAVAEDVLQEDKTATFGAASAAAETPRDKHPDAIRLPVWAVTLITATLLSLLAATVSLVMTITTLKTEVGRLSALIAIVKDDVEVLGQK